MHIHMEAEHFCYYSYSTPWRAFNFDIFMYSSLDVEFFLDCFSNPKSLLLVFYFPNYSSENNNTYTASEGGFVSNHAIHRLIPLPPRVYTCQKSLILLWQSQNIHVYT